MVMVRICANELSVPHGDIFTFQTINVPSERKSRENTEYNEYKGDDVHDKVFQQVLKQSYSMFRLFTGTFRSHFNGEEDETQKIEHFKSILEHFFSRVRV